MMRLTKVELRRLFSRRLTTIALLGAMVITGLLLFASYEQAKPLSAAELTSQRVQFDMAHEDWVVNGARYAEECLAQQVQLQKTDPKASLGCEQMEPRWEGWGKPQAKFAEQLPSTLLSGAYLLAAVGLLVGAGFVTAEFSSGSIGNWLTFEPRRTRVYGSKLAAAGLGLFPATVALLGLLTAGVWLIVSRYSSAAGPTVKLWGDLGQMGGRAVALVMVAAVVGAAMGMLLRHTAAVIGILVGYLVLVESVLGGALKNAQPWLLGVNVRAWLQHDTKYFVESCTTDLQGNYACQGVEKVLTFGHSSAYLGLLVVFVVGLAALVFRRRDAS